MLSEPPGADPHAGWCGRGQGEPGLYPIRERGGGKGPQGTSPPSYLTKVDARVLAELSFRDLVPAIWLATPELRAERERARWRLHLVKHRAILKNRVHASLIAFGHQVPMADKRRGPWDGRPQVRRRTGATPRSRMRGANPTRRAGAAPGPEVATSTR